MKNNIKKEIFSMQSQLLFNFTMFLMLLFLTNTSFGQDKSKVGSTQLNPNYDKALAKKLNADDYGMKPYFLVILKTGTNTTADKKVISESFQKHMENISNLVEQGKLIVAGPIERNENNYRGIFILDNIKSKEEAEKLLQRDLAIKNKLLDYDIYNWYRSAALAEYLPISDKIWKLKP